MWWCDGNTVPGYTTLLCYALDCGNVSCAQLSMAGIAATPIINHSKEVPDRCKVAAKVFFIKILKWELATKIPLNCVIFNLITLPC